MLDAELRHPPQQDAEHADAEAETEEQDQPGALGARRIGGGSGGGGGPPPFAVPRGGGLGALTRFDVHRGGRLAHLAPFHRRATLGGTPTSVDRGSPSMPGESFEFTAAPRVSSGISPPSAAWLSGASHEGRSLCAVRGRA